MGIASGIFWIIFGLLYIWYQSFKEHPSETLAGTFLCLCVIFGIVAYTYIYRWLMEKNLWLGAIFCFGVLGFVFYKLIKFQHEASVEDAKRRHEYEEYKARVRSTLTEEDYKAAAMKYRHTIFCSMNENDFNYWKKEPYWSKVKLFTEIDRGAELRKADEEQKKLNAE